MGSAADRAVDGLDAGGHVRRAVGAVDPVAREGGGAGGDQAGGGDGGEDELAHDGAPLGECGGGRQPELTPLS